MTDVTLSRLVTHTGDKDLEPEKKKLFACSNFWILYVPFMRNRLLHWKFDLNYLWSKRLSFACLPVQLREWVDHVQVNDQQTKPPSLNIKISFQENCLIKKPLDQNS